MREKIDIARRIVKPENCVLAFGIPVTKETFLADQQQKDNDFARLFNGIWQRYFFEIVRYVQKAAPIFTQLGLHIQYDLTLPQFGELCRDSKFDVIILFSHWLDNAVEFADGLAETESIITQIPPGFSNFLDLCVCHPESLIIALREHRPNCLTRYIDKPATPKVWLYFYLELFNYLKQQEVTYLQALEGTLARILKYKTNRENI